MKYIKLKKSAFRIRHRLESVHYIEDMSILLNNDNGFDAIELLYKSLMIANLIKAVIARFKPIATILNENKNNSNNNG